MATATEIKEAIKPENVPILPQTVYMIGGAPILSEIKLTDRILKCVELLMRNTAHIRALIIKKDVLRDYGGVVMSQNGLFDQSLQTAIVSVEAIRRQSETQILWGNKDLGGDLDHVPMSFQHSVMFGFLRTVAHEVVHSLRYHNMEFLPDVKKEEEIVKAEAQKQLISLAKTTNIEPDVNWEWLESETKAFRDSIKTEDGAEDVDEWIKIQQYLIDNSVCWKDKKHTLLTLKSWLRLQAPDGNDGTVWEKNTWGAETTAVVPLDGVQQTVLLQEMLNTTAEIPYDDAPFDMDTPAVQPTNIFAAMMSQFSQPAPVIPTQPATDWAPINQCMTEMFKRMFTHVFSNGWTPQGLGNGEMLAKALVTPINIADLSAKAGISLVKTYSASVNGHWNGSVHCDGASVMMDITKEGLPKFGFTFDINGVQGSRLFVVQNPQKRNADGSFSKRALMAQAGSAMAWIINKDTNTMVLEAYWDGQQIQVTPPRKV